VTAFANVVAALQELLPDFGSAPTLNIGAETDNNAINAFAANGNTVQVNLALPQLISDSPSELAFAIAHESGHIYQQRAGKFAGAQIKSGMPTTGACWEHCSQDTIRTRLRGPSTN